MTNPNQRLEPFDETFQQPNIHRGKRYGKKKRSLVSMIIQIIVVILTAIAGYSMWKQPIFNIVFTKESVDFDGIKNFNETIGEMHQLNINLGNINDLQQGIDRLILVFNGFFILCIVSLVITILTIVFNRTVLKVVNILVLTIMLVITLYFSYIIKALAQEIADVFKKYYLNVPPDQVITEADAIHNGIILLGCSIGLLVISLFFRNRMPRLK
ncbi:TPA: hypothetical protein OT649_001175 [Staphylococcus aureus]|nr:hypothetical protein [Staphylococcus aureus]